MTETTADPFERALAGLLGPLARAVVARGVTLGAVNEALKRALLEAVIEMEGAAVSDSRISLRTGLHRKDVKRLRSEAPVSRRPSLNAAALTISHWATMPDFISPEGLPRLLHRHDSDDGPGFDELVRRTRVDLAPGTVLQALLGEGAVTIADEGQLCLVTRAYLPAAGSAEQVAAYQATLSAHLTAATDNLTATEGAQRHFDRVLRYSHLSAASVAELDRVARLRAQAALEELDAMARGFQDADAVTGARGRFAFGAYILPTAPAPEPALRESKD